jgi:hypothetical protein
MEVIMAVPVPGSVSGNVVSEYAATNIGINRVIIDQNGILVAAFNAQVNYEKKTYVVDANGNKIGLVTTQDQNVPMPTMNDQSRGFISLDFAAFAQYFSKVCVGGEILGEEVANLADNLIHQDLINRGILTA